MNKVLKLTALAGAVLSIIGMSGCSALNVGEEEFACNGMPGSVYCHSARDVYEKTNDGVVPSPVGKKEGAYNEDCDDCIRAEDVNPELTVEEDDQSQYAITRDGRRLKVIDGRVSRTSNGQMAATNDDGQTVVLTGDEVIDNYVTPALPDSPVPIRTPAQVMRIWVAPYVDTSGDLIAPGFVYTEVESRRWIYPENEAIRGNGKHFSPLNAPKLIQQGNTYSSPKSYSNPDKANRDSHNSLLKFQKNREETLKQMK